MTTDLYWNHITDAASVSAFSRDEEPNSTVSAETVPENESFLDFSAFAAEYPEKIFPLLHRLRPEFSEMFIEYHIMHKSQSFLAKVHGEIQTRIWQQLRIIEKAVGALIVLGTDPSDNDMRPTLRKENLEDTQYGSLARMIFVYARCQNYKHVADAVHAPVPAIRKIFRPAIETLLASKNIKAVAIGAYLKNLTHQASLKGQGLSKRYLARIRRTKGIHFTAPEPVSSPLISYGMVSLLKDTPWNMFEISSEHRMEKIFPLIHKYGKKVFGKKTAQIFAPTDANGELELGYILARSTKPEQTQALTRIRGISDMAARYSESGSFVHAITVPNADVQLLISKHVVSSPDRARLGDFVEILTGDAARYCGLVFETDPVKIRVAFDSGRCFVVTAEPGAYRVIPVPATLQCFWGRITTASK